MWQKIAKEYETIIASSTGSSPDVGDAASCTGHHEYGSSPDADDAACALAAEEPREGTGTGLCKDGGE